MWKSIIAAVMMFAAASAMATPTVLFSVADASGMTQQTGQLVAGSSHVVTFRLADGAWDDTATYSLTIKPDGRYDDDAFVLMTGASFDVSAADLTVTIDLNIAELYTYLGRADSRTVMFELADASSAYVVRHRVIVSNSVRRPTDTAPANPAENTYTDAEVDAMITAIPAGVEPVADPIDGWTVQCSDTGQIEIGPIAATQMLQDVTEYPETTTLATQDYLLIYDASAEALRKVSMSTLLTWISANLP